MAKSTRGAESLEMLDVDAKNYKVLGHMTWHIWQAVKADASIRLDAAFDPNKKGKKKFNDQLRVAVGVFEWKEIRNKLKAVPIKEAERFFSNGTKRTNFAHTLKKCAQAAAGLIDLSATVRMNEKIGTLVISGPQIAGAFGKYSVALDERLTEGLTQKPSYTAISAIAKERRGIVAARGSNTRGIGANVSSDSDFEIRCRDFIEFVNGCNVRANKRQASALHAVLLAVRKALG